MKATPHQQEKLSQALSILKREDRLVLTGSAGVGKTFLVDLLIKRLPISPYKAIYCSAPTNKAVSVLREKVTKGDRIEFLTTHSAMKLKRAINYRTGEVSFKPYFTEKYPPLKGVGLLIIDESSMLNSDLLGHIETYSEKFNVKVVFIGDEKQLPPVGEEESPIFTRDYPKVELTEIVRQAAGNPIIGLSRNLSHIRKKEDDFMVIDEERYGIIHSNDREIAINSLAKVNGTDELKYLAYTNKEVNLMNKLVRQRIYQNPAKIELGETMIFNSPYKTSFFTNQEVKVEKLLIREKFFYYENDKYGSDTNKAGEVPKVGRIRLKYYSINPDIKPNEKIIDNIVVVHEDSEKEYDKIVSALRKKAKTATIDWVNFYEFIEQFADLKYNHALTVHKSQGSTFKKVIVNMRNLNLNRREKERNKLIYTGITRASNLLILFDA